MDDRASGNLRADRSQDLQGAHFEEIHIEGNQIGRFRGKFRQGFFAGGGINDHGRTEAANEQTDEKLLAMLLSIVITTYNRSNYLAQLLGQLSREWEDDRWAIEVLVADNASTDDTREVVESARRDGLKVNYICRESNIKFPGNLRNGLSEVSGLYVWPLCDDDLLESGALRSVIESIEHRQEVPIFILNRNIYDIRMQRIVRKNLLEANGTFAADAREIIEKWTYGLLTASCVVIKREYGLAGSRRPEFEGYFCETLVLGCEALAHGKAIVLADVYVRYREGNAGAWNILWPVISLYCIPYVIDKADIKMVYPGLLRVFLENRTHDLGGEVCSVASTRKEEIRRLIDRKLLKEWYSFKPSFQWWYFFAFSLPKIVPRIYVHWRNICYVVGSYISSGGRVINIPKLLVKKYLRMRSKEKV